MNGIDRTATVQQRARHRLAGPCAGCGSPVPELGAFAMRGRHDGPGVARWICRPCMVLAAISQRQRDFISRTLALPAADTGIEAAGRCAADVLGGV